ncbi:MAG: hypothetical protein AB3N33_01455 [Puniceicoccaceae bacterium]
MKSAYELAMERLEKEDPQGSVSLTDEQKAELDTIEKKYQARIAEKEIFLKKQLTEARLQGDGQALEQLETQLRNERQRLEEEKEAAKEKVRQA